MAYQIDLAAISLESHREDLRNADLVPSRRFLKENIDKQFEKINAAGVTTLEDLNKALKNKKALESFAEQSGVDLNYLTVLIREVRSMISKPNRFQDFPSMPEETVAKLEAQKITNTRHLYERTITIQARVKLASETDLPEHEVLRLTKLSDLSRIRWVNHTFAYMLYETGYETAQQVAEAHVEEMHQKICGINDERQFYRGKIGMHDIKLCVEAAQKVSFDIEY